MTMDEPATSVSQDRFRQQTPTTYRWALGASGLVSMATTVTLSVAPEVAGYALAGLILFILLMFIVVNLEIGTTAVANANPLAQNARAQVKVLSWFATIALIIGAASVMSSMLIAWPLQIALVQDTTSKKFLDSIKRYDLSQSSIEHISAGVWQEKSQRDNSIIYTFGEISFTPQFLILSDDKRHVKLRVPTRGGMLEWSTNEKIRDCDNQYCWGDVDQAIMFR